MFTFEERFNEGISGTDAMTNGETAADVMKVVKEEVLMVGRFPPFRLDHASCLILSLSQTHNSKKEISNSILKQNILTVIRAT